MRASIPLSVAARAGTIIPAYWCRREKNRIAARDSRARKMQTLVNLRTDVASLHNANEQLKAKISEVTEQATVAQQLYWQLKVKISITNVTLFQQPEKVGQVSVLVSEQPQKPFNCLSNFPNFADHLQNPRPSGEY